MADVVYTATVKLDTANHRAQAVEGLCTLLRHLEGLSTFLRSIEVSLVDGTITVTVSKALPADQLAHLGIG